MSKNGQIGTCRRGLFLALLLIGAEACTTTLLEAQIVETGRTVYGEPGDIRNVTDIVVDREGNVVATGWITGDGARQGEIQTISWTSNGEERWARRHSIPGGEEMEGRSLISDGDGGVYVAGLGESGKGERDILLLHYNADGSTAGTIRYDDREVDEGSDLLLGNDRSLFLLGWSRQPGMPADLLLVHFDISGEELWSRHHGDPDEGEYPADFILDGEGDPVVAATTFDTLQHSDLLLTAWSSAGEVRWNRRYDFGSDDYAVALAREESGSLLLLGTGSSGNASLVTLVAVSPDGSELWRRTWGEAGESLASRTILSRPGGGWVIAVERERESGRRDLILLDVDAAGEISPRTTVGAPGREYRIREMAFDRDGNLVVLGTLRGLTLPPGLILLSISDDGTLLYEHEFGDGRDRSSLVGGLALDPDDQIVVAGIADDGAGGRLTQVRWFEVQASGVDGVAGSFSSSPGELAPLQPNPFVDATTISWRLRREAEIRVEILDVEGRSVETLFEGRSDVGPTELRWRPVDLPSGAYICRLTVGDYHAVQKVLYQKQGGG